MAQHKRRGKNTIRSRLKRRLRKRRDIVYALLLAALMITGFMFVYYVGYLRGFYETTMAKQIAVCVDICKVLDKGWVSYGY